MLNLNFQEGKYDGIWVFLCFFGGAIAGYLLVNHAAVLGI
jgi:hypothetical protein